MKSFWPQAETRSWKSLSAQAWKFCWDRTLYATEIYLINPFKYDIWYHKILCVDLRFLRIITIFALLFNITINILCLHHFIFWRVTNILMYWYNSVDSLCPSDTIWVNRTCSTLIQVNACCLRVSNHYMNQNWLTSSEVVHLRAISPEIIKKSILGKCLKIAH